MAKKYFMVAGASPLTRVFHFPAALVAREFAKRLAKKGILTTIIVEESY